MCPICCIVYSPHIQTMSFNVFILGTILLNAITIAMETTTLSETVPLFFVATDNVFLAIYILEFVLKVSNNQCFKNSDLRSYNGDFISMLVHCLS